MRRSGSVISLVNQSNKLHFDQGESTLSQSAQYTTGKARELLYQAFEQEQQQMCLSEKDKQNKSRCIKLKRVKNYYPRIKPNITNKFDYRQDPLRKRARKIIEKYKKKMQQQQEMQKQQQKQLNNNEHDYNFVSQLSPLESRPQAFAYEFNYQSCYYEAQMNRFPQVAQVNVPEIDSFSAYMKKRQPDIYKNFEEVKQQDQQVLGKRKGPKQNNTYNKTVSKQWHFGNQQSFEINDFNGINNTSMKVHDHENRLETLSIFESLN